MKQNPHNTETGWGFTLVICPRGGGGGGGRLGNTLIGALMHVDSYYMYETYLSILSDEFH